METADKADNEVIAVIVPGNATTNTDKTENSTAKPVVKPATNIIKADKFDAANTVAVNATTGTAAKHDTNTNATASAADTVDTFASGASDDALATTGAGSAAVAMLAATLLAAGAGLGFVSRRENRM